MTKLNQNTNEINIDISIKQGNSISPNLFNLALVCKYLQEQNNETRTDDIVFTAKLSDELQRMLIK